MVFSMQPSEIYSKALIKYGMYDYLPKITPEEETINRLRAFLGNEQPPRNISSLQTIDTPFSNLTPREHQVLPYLLQGARIKEIANELDLKGNTISTLKTQIFMKTNTGNLRELIDLAGLFNI
jgi:two-component system, LuxR family, response regulator FixJ